MTIFKAIKKTLEEANVTFGFGCDGTFLVAGNDWEHSVHLAKKLFVRIKINELWRDVYPDRIMALVTGEELIVWNPRWRKKGCLQRDLGTFRYLYDPDRRYIKVVGEDFKIIICPFPGR
jgi:hypothetical protein